MRVISVVAVSKNVCMAGFKRRYAGRLKGLYGYSYSHG